MAQTRRPPQRLVAGADLAALPACRAPCSGRCAWWRPCGRGCAPSAAAAPQQPETPRNSVRATLQQLRPASLRQLRPRPPRSSLKPWGTAFVPPRSSRASVAMLRRLAARRRVFVARGLGCRLHCPRQQLQPTWRRCCKCEGVPSARPGLLHRLPVRGQSATQLGHAAAADAD